MRLELDHLAVSGATLEEAVAHVEDALGVKMAPGGKHDAMATHNRLLSLGPGVYLEAIAIDPEAPSPGRPRWFDLDRFSGVARLTNWILRTDDLESALEQGPAGLGTPMALSRGDFLWRMAVPDDGILPFDNLAPALIQWDGDAHPSHRLEDVGCRLDRVEIAHPRAMDLMPAFPEVLRLPDVRIGPGPKFEMRAEIFTPHGLRYLR